MRMNERFKARWVSERLTEALPRVVLEPRLHDVVHAPFVRCGDALVLAPFIEASTRREAFEDATAWEAFINKVQVEDLLTENLGISPLTHQGVRAAIDLAERLRSEGAFRVVLSLDPDAASMTLRFFGLREGAAWNSDDLDAYEHEEILVIDP